MVGSPQIAAAARPGRASNSHHPKMTNHTAIADVPVTASAGRLQLVFVSRFATQPVRKCYECWFFLAHWSVLEEPILALARDDWNGATNRPAASASLTYGS